MFNMASDDREVDYKLTNISNTLAARDYKGPNNYGFNAVVEYEED